MATTPWKDLVLCTRSDVEVESGPLDNLVQSATAANAIANAIAAAKDQIRQELQQSLPELFVDRSAGLYGIHEWIWGSTVIPIGYTFAELDKILDRLANPEELRNAAVARTMLALINRAVVQSGSDYATANEIWSPMRKAWQIEYDRRYAIGVRLLQIDMKQDGNITDEERVRSKNYFDVV